MSLSTALPCSLPPSGCHTSADDSTPTPETLSYTFALPGTAASSGIARSLLGVTLQAHGLRPLADAALQVASELLSCACQFAEGIDVQLTLRYHDEELWLIVNDRHRRHRNPRIGELCDARREETLHLLERVVDVCHGQWGHDDALEPGGGTRMWAALPHAGAAAYNDPEIAPSS